MCRTSSPSEPGKCQTTQTEVGLLNRGRFFQQHAGIAPTNTPNGTSPCNHPSLTCQELLALSTALSATLTAQIGFEAKQLKHCSTYNLAEGDSSAPGSASTTYGTGDEYELAVSEKKGNRFTACLECATGCLSSCQKHLEAFVDHHFFQKFILFCILINTFSLGIEYHEQPDLLTRTVEISNLVFSIIFAFEMCLKLTAYGLFRYISDGFNVFDGVIVLLRFVRVLCVHIEGPFLTFFHPAARWKFTTLSSTVSTTKDREFPFCGRFACFES